MNKEQKIAMLESRAKNLEARGSHNNRIVAKTRRIIRKLQREN